jgi:hypothetical protein
MQALAPTAQSGPAFSICLDIILRCRKRLLAENCGRCAIRGPLAMTTAESNFRFRCYRIPELGVVTARGG